MSYRLHNFFRRSFAQLALAGVIVFSALPRPAAAYRMDLPPTGPQVAGAAPTVSERPNALLPLELSFNNSDGKTVQLGDMFNHGRPVILLMVYFSCPFMCGLNQDSLTDTVLSGPRDLKLGKDYDVLIVSIDPDDTPEVAAQKRKYYLAHMDRPESQEGLTYLTGTQANIQTLADAIGYHFYRNPPGGTDKFVHPLAQFIITPTGHLSSLLANNVSQSYTPDEMRAALLLAADGKIGSTTINFLISCGAMRLVNGHYQANPWFYAGVAGGLGSLAFMGIFLGVLWRGEYRKHQAAKNAPHDPNDPLNPVPTH